jgi:hypothetical protein
MTQTLNTRHIFDAPIESELRGAEYADLPFHQLEINTRQCIYCGESPEWATYTEYYDNWYGARRDDWFSSEYSGYGYPHPEPQCIWEYLNATCLSPEKEVRDV